MSYRSRIYARYASVAQNADQGTDLAPGLPEMDRWGTAYDAYLRGWLPTAREAPIVDVACGGGRLLRFFTQRGFTRVTGVDVSPEQVAMARRVHPEVLQADVVEFLESHRDTFALITAFDILEHLNKDEVLRFLDACYGALRPGGQLMIQTPNADSSSGMSVRYGDFTHETCFTPHSLAWLLRLCGFDSVAAREQGPVPHGAASSVRYLLWRLLRLSLLARNLVETGSRGSGILTRVFIAQARKP